MQVSWLLERDMFPDYQDALIAEIKKQGQAVEFIPDLGWGYSWEDVDSPYLDLFPEDACVLFHGSINMATQIADEAPWVPGVYCNWERLECLAYYCPYAKYLVNDDYVMLPFGELSRQRRFLFDILGKDDAIFVRPNTGRKSFTGQVARWHDFDKELEYMAFYDVPPEALVIVSSPKKLVSEWRFLVASGRVIAGSLYKTDGQMDIRREIDPAAQALANEIAAQKFQPDLAWTLDICETAEGAFRLLEIGGFSSAGLYACDLAAVVRGISELAIQDWELAGEEEENEESVNGVDNPAS